jgi:WD40 repeat protein
LDGKLYLFNAATGELRRVVRGHLTRITSVAASPDGLLLASGSADGTVRLWSVPEGRAIQVLSTGQGVVLDVAFSADSTLLAAAVESAAWIWDLTIPALPGTPAPPSQALDVARFSPDGAHIASVGHDGAVRLWDASSGELLASWAEHEAWATGVCFTSDGTYLASVGFDGVLAIQDAKSAAARHRISYGDRLLAIACAPDKNQIASAGYDAVVRLWDAASGELVHTLKPRPSLSMVESLAYSTDGLRLVVGRHDGRIEVWDIASQKIAQVFSGHTLAIAGLALDASGSTLASGSLDRSVRLWSMRDGAQRILGEFAGRVHRLGWDPRRKRLALPTSTGELEVLSLDTPQRTTFVAHRSEVNNIEFSPDGKTAVSVGDDGVLKLWDTTTWRPKWMTRALVWAPTPKLLTHTGWRALDSSGQLMFTSPPEGAWRSAVEAAQETSMQPGGVLCMSTEKGLEIWDMRANALRETVRLAPPFQVAAASEGCAVLREGKAMLYRPGKAALELAEGTGVQSAGEELAVLGSEVRFFDTQGNSLGSFASAEGSTAATRIGEQVAVGFKNGDIEMRSGAERLPIYFQDTPASQVTRIIAGPSDTFVAGFADGSFGIWSLSNGERLERGAVHGAVRLLLIQNGILMVASEVGAAAALDLSLLTEDYCTLLAEVWSRVPVLWRDQGAVVQPQDSSHPCR